MSLYGTSEERTRDEEPVKLLIELRFYVPLDTSYVILEMFFPAGILKKLNLTQQKQRTESTQNAKRKQTYKN